MKDKRGINAVIFGSTGMVGKEKQRKGAACNLYHRIPTKPRIRLFVVQIERQLQ